MAKTTVPFSSVYVGTGDCGLVLTGGTLGGTIIAGEGLSYLTPLCGVSPYFVRCKLDDKACRLWMVSICLASREQAGSLKVALFCIGLILLSGPSLQGLGVWRRGNFGGLIRGFCASERLESRLSIIGR